MQGLLSNELLSKSSLFGSSGGSNIKSIQSGIADVVNSTYSLNVAISEVNLNKTIVIVNEAADYNGAGPNNVKVKGKLINSTTLNLSIGATSGGMGAAKVTWQVVEFKDVKSLQIGELAFSSTTSQDITISKINLSKSILIFSFNSTQSTAVAESFVLQGYLSTDTTLAFRTGFSSYANICWQVIEFN